MRIRQWTVCFILSLALLSPLRVNAACTWKSVLEEHLEKSHANDPLYVLTYDHAQGSGWWKGYWWNGSDLDPLEKPELSLEAADYPRIHASKQRKSLAVFVVNTNPLLYTTTPGASSETDREDLEKLQQLATLLGNLGVAALEIGTQIDLRMQDAEDSSGLMTVQSLEHELPAWFPDQERSKLARMITDAKPALEALGATLKVWRSDLSPPLTKIKQSGQQLNENIEQFAIQRTAADNYLRHIELGTLGTSMPTWPSFSQLAESFSELQEAQSTLRSQETPCTATLTKLARAFELQLRGLPQDPLEESKRKEEYAGISSQLESGKLQCPEIKLNQNAKAPLQALGEWLATLPLLQGGPPSSVAKTLNSYRDACLSYLNLATKRKEALKTASELLTRGSSLGKDAQRYAVVKKRYDEYDLKLETIDACALNHGFIEVTRAQGIDLVVPPTKIRTESFKVAFDAAFKDAIQPTRPESVERKYELQRVSRWLEFDVDLGLVHTDVINPVFGAVTVETPSADMNASSVVAADETENEEPPKQIAIVDEESRSGDIALFASWIPYSRQWLRAGPQLGVGLDTDKPALFAGLAVGLGPYVKLSGGWTWQEVRELARDQALGETEVMTEDDIRTRRTYDDDWYLALTISIDNLPFFSGGNNEEE